MLPALSEHHMLGDDVYDSLLETRRQYLATRTSSPATKAFNRAPGGLQSRRRKSTVCAGLLSGGAHGACVRRNTKAIAVTLGDA